jgi:hypothetical protein
MQQLAIFTGTSFFILSLLLGIQWKNKIPYKSAMALFALGIMLSVPFIMVEYLAFSMKYYFVIISFVIIELGILYLEQRIKPLHDLMHHNIRDLRMVSFLLIGLGFTLSELSFFIFNAHEPALDIIRALPGKTVYAIFMHTVFTSAASLKSIGELAEGFIESIFKVASYYLKIIFISSSHYIYIFFLEHRSTLLILPFIALNMAIFIQYMRYLDKKRLTV